MKHDKPIKCSDSSFLMFIQELERQRIDGRIIIERIIWSFVLSFFGNTRGIAPVRAGDTGT